MGINNNFRRSNRAPVRAKRGKRHIYIYRATVRLATWACVFGSFCFHFRFNFSRRGLLLNWEIFFVSSFAFLWFSPFYFLMFKTCLTTLIIADKKSVQMDLELHPGSNNSSTRQGENDEK